MEERIRQEIPGGGWYLGSFLVSFLVGGLAGFAVVDLFPESSDGPIMLGIAVAVALFSCLAVSASICARIVTALAELGRSSDGERA